MGLRIRDEGGANAVEFALVLPVLVMLVFGVLWGGLALNSQVALNQSAREAARFGATLPEIGTSAWFDDVEARLLETLEVQLTSGTAAGCIRAYGASGVWLGSRSVEGGSCSATLATTTRTQEMPRVEVEVESSAFSIGSLFPATQLGADAIARYELIEAS